MEGHFLACTCGPDIVYFAVYEDFPTASYGPCEVVQYRPWGYRHRTLFHTWMGTTDWNFGNIGLREHLIYCSTPCMWNFPNAKNVNFSLSNAFFTIKSLSHIKVDWQHRFFLHAVSIHQRNVYSYLYYHYQSKAMQLVQD